MKLAILLRGQVIGSEVYYDKEEEFIPSQSLIHYLKKGKYFTTVKVDGCIRTVYTADLKFI